MENDQLNTLKIEIAVRENAIQCIDKQFPSTTDKLTSVENDDFSDVFPQLFGLHRHDWCDFEDGKFYCKSWTCADPDCPEEQQLAQEGSSCPICPDTCTNGGIIFDKGDSIKCVDGSNKCTCTDTGVVISTRRGTNKFWLCGVPEN
uniref:Uncharacterized protein n=1 Tax=Magallana gigas TaxID=29159 RepID=A0A8W8KZ76_MAGGI